MAQVAKQASEQQAMQAPRGSVRTCVPYRGELARHRLITADGHDYIVTTTRVPAAGHGTQRPETYVTGAYPVLRGYLVMMRQPLYEISRTDSDAAREQHEQLVRVLAEAGVGVVRARRSLAARLRAEKAEAAKAEAAHSVVVEIGAGARAAREERKPVALS